MSPLVHQGTTTKVTILEARHDDFKGAQRAHLLRGTRGRQHRYGSHTARGHSVNSRQKITT